MIVYGCVVQTPRGVNKKKIYQNYINILHYYIILRVTTIDQPSKFRRVLFQTWKKNGVRSRRTCALSRRLSLSGTRRTRRTDGQTGASGAVTEKTAKRDERQFPSARKRMDSLKNDEKTKSSGWVRKSRTEVKRERENRRNDIMRI